jgi:hypothetical protein
MRQAVNMQLPPKIDDVGFGTAASRLRPRKSLMVFSDQAQQPAG